MYYSRIVLAFVLFFLITQTNLAQGSDEHNEDLERCRGVVQDLYRSLLTELRAAMKQGGTEKAINVCHEAAQRITESFKTAEQSVRRVTLQLRSPKNEPDSYEKEKLMQLAVDHEEGELKDEYYEVVEEDGVTYFRYLSPILVKPPCLMCHGKEEKLSPAVLSVLKVKYPEDKAFGYSNGDLRGAFSVIIRQ